MRAFNRWLVGIAMIMFLSNAVSAQGALEEVSSGDSAGKVFGKSGVGDMVQAASDFRKATERWSGLGGCWKVLFRPSPKASPRAAAIMR